MKRDFLLDLSTGFLYDCLEHEVRKFDGNEFRATTLVAFSGTLSIDEIHLGPCVVWIASDPVADMPVACALVSSNDSAHVQRFLQNLNIHGFLPHTVITDRSQLYPATTATVWPQAKHQQCVFHVISVIKDHVLDAVREVRRSIKPKRIKKGRGRPSKRHQSRAKKLKEQKDQADRLFRKRHLIVTKRSNMKSCDAKVLEEQLSLSQILETLRSLVDDLHELFSIRRQKKTAWKIRARMTRNRSNLENDYLAEALEVLNKGTMTKLLHDLDQSPKDRSKIRTNNHFERCNRPFRFLETVRYKWRCRRTIIRRILPQFSNWMIREENHAQLAA